MSGESSFSRSLMRFLRPEEIELLGALLAGHQSAKSLLANITETRIRDLKDGQMGSIELAQSYPGRRMSKCIAEADYVDLDGVSVTITVNIDQQGKLFEIDIWKVDFSPLVRYPSPQTIRNIQVH